VPHDSDLLIAAATAAARLVSVTEASSITVCAMLRALALNVSCNAATSGVRGGDSEDERREEKRRKEKRREEKRREEKRREEKRREEKKTG
jgi:hypothetical protein